MNKIFILPGSKKLSLILSLSAITLVILILTVNILKRSGFTTEDIPFLRNTVQVTKPLTEEQIIETVSDLKSKYRPLPATKIAPFKKLSERLSDRYISEPDFSIAYSGMFFKFFVQKKTENADIKIKELLQQYDMADLYTGQADGFFVITPLSANFAVAAAEEEFQKVQDEIYLEKLGNVKGIATDIYALENSPEPDPESMEAINNMDIVVGGLKSFLQFGLPEPDPEADSAAVTPPGGSTGTLTEFAQDFNGDSLSGGAKFHELLNEVATTIGIPAKLLKAVINVECTTALVASDEEIAESYSPSALTTYCNPPNRCSAVGPMQITVGVDGDGDTSCPRCGKIGQCPNAAPKNGGDFKAAYGYDHEPNVYNFRDNIYVGAYMYRSYGGVDTPQQWTEPVIVRAIGCYHNGPNSTACKTGTRADNISSYYTKVLDYYFSQ